MAEALQAPPLQDLVTAIETATENRDRTFAQYDAARLALAKSVARLGLGVGSSQAEIDAAKRAIGDLQAKIGQIEKDIYTAMANLAKGEATLARQRSEQLSDAPPSVQAAREAHLAGLSAIGY